MCVDDRVESNLSKSIHKAGLLCTKPFLAYNCKEHVM